MGRLTRVFLYACTLPATQWGGSSLSLKSSDARLVSAFEWARHQALAYAFEGDPVGEWYEASLPGRQAFCMRDTAHQSAGAHFLGLHSHTLNMLRKFAENISDSKDWCSYWEIDRYNRPSSADYRDDTRFWYNLPANFDVLDACYRNYVLSGDSAYVVDPVFLNFYRRTVHDYVERWDLAVDRIMARPRIMNLRGHFDLSDRFQRNRGIPSYEEAHANFTVAVDQLATQYAGYVAYARISQLRGDLNDAKELLSRADAMRALVNKKWWDERAGSFYSQVNPDHQLEGHAGDASLLYYQVAEEGEKSGSVLASILAAIEEKQPQVELESYLPEVLYRYGKPEAAYNEILDLTREGKDRREYPEVSYAVVQAIVDGLMGIATQPLDDTASHYGNVQGQRCILTTPALSSHTNWVETDNVPLAANTIRVRHDGLASSTFENKSGPSLVWKACLPGSFSTLLVGDKAVAAEHMTVHDHAISCVAVVVGSGDTKRVQSVGGK